MKVAISSAEPQLESQVDPRFGRCAYLIFYDTEKDEWEALPNTSRDAAGGAGIRTAQLVVNNGADVVVTGNIGPNAMQVLSGQVKVYTGFSGTVEEAIKNLKAGTLAETSAPTVGEHAGLSKDAGFPDAGSPPPGGFGGPMDTPGGWRPGRGWGRGRGSGGGRW